MQNLYSFYWNVRRMGSVEGLFICDPDVLESHYGDKVYFGEILGKHSEIYGTIDREDIKLVSDDQEKVEWLFNLLGGSVSGYNPLDYLSEQDEEEFEEYEDE